MLCGGYETIGHGYANVTHVIDRFKPTVDFLHTRPS